ncbi:histone-lysine N-methyltransferase ATXR2 isoform X1 [Juglans microcarpa x Juglans regia]|uniref:histone-lysine N-methyltransferase ATXR2 isoform X1 n=2 Tax=Juglans microcarpa x Juglans regia TaxID=2249226 RepID=UPI001B7F06B2|nr:histone-lysine N-methyltransferase ATXR2 isoform X1 [Juglans microcarpa x Juglans regia]
METICSIDAALASEISHLLTSPSPPQVQEYFDNLISTRKCHGIKVKPNGEFGKGVYADLDFKEGELVFKDQMLVGAQHCSNKIDCLVCSFCFCFIGSIELQIGRRLYLQGLGVSMNHGSDMETFKHISKDCSKTDSNNGEYDSLLENHDNLGNCPSSSSKQIFTIPKDVVESLMNGELMLPYSKQFSLPPPVPCAGGCGEAYYCSKSCAEADWELSHSLLCTGERSESSCREALIKFIQHANETNDIFLVAAKVISSTILMYRKLKATRLKENEKCATPNVLDHSDISLLLEAWKPISMGHKRRWWDCIALPDDVDSSDESAFRMQIRELAFTSLQLLKAAIFDKECEPLFSLETYGHIIGMFELNNLDLVVASPVEDYFLYIDDLPYTEKQEAEQVTQPFLDALGDDYSVCCQGTGFFPLQSCMNHSCCPNAKAFKREEDRDGQATLIALCPISKGEEVTISYVDEDLPFEERQALLADYGFKCKCPKCLQEET